LSAKWNSKAEITVVQKLHQTSNPEKRAVIVFGCALFVLFCTNKKEQIIILQFKTALRLAFNLFLRPKN
jgi:hypothetical protein